MLIWACGKVKLKLSSRRVVIHEIVQTCFGHDLRLVAGIARRYGAILKVKDVLVSRGQ
jgi:hypothetical protein